MINSKLLEIYLPDTVFENKDGRLSIDSIKNIVLKKAETNGLSLSARTDTLKSRGFIFAHSDPCVIFFQKNRYDSSIKMIIKVSIKGETATVSAGVVGENMSIVNRLRHKIFRNSYIKENYFKEAINEKYTDFFDETVNDLFSVKPVV